MRLPKLHPHVRELGALEPFRRQFNDMFADFGPWRAIDWVAAPKAAAAAFQIAETEEAVEIAMELQDVAESDVHVAVKGQTVVVCAEKKLQSENSDEPRRVEERSYGVFRRVVRLPFAPDRDKIAATFDKGALHIKIAKSAGLVAEEGPGGAAE